jgi:hypothetical protein
MEPTQRFELIRDVPHKIIPEYHTKVTKFQNVRNITLFIDANFGGDTTLLNYVGFKGDFMTVSKDPIITLYELAPNPADHQKIADKTTNSNSIQ